MKPARTDFDASLARLRAVVDDVAANTGPALTDATLRGRHEVYLCGVVILLTGYFETFLKEAVRLFVAHVSGSGKPFVALPSKLQQHHYEGGGRILTEVAKAGRKTWTTKWASSPSDVASRLSSAASGGTYSILWEAFADTRSNPTSDVVSELLGRLGISDPWGTIEQHTGTMRAGHMTANLNSLVSVRNTCAHTGGASPMPTTGVVIDYLESLKAIAQGLSDVLEDEAARY